MHLYFRTTFIHNVRFRKHSRKSHLGWFGSKRQYSWVSFQILPTEYAKEDMLSGFGSSLNCAIHPRACMKLLSLLRNNENLCTWFSLLSAVFRKNFVLSRRRLRVRTKQRKPYRTHLSFVAWLYPWRLHIMVHGQTKGRMVLIVQNKPFFWSLRATWLKF